MIHLWYSNYLERLADVFAQAIQQQDPLVTPTVIVPNRNLETWLKLEVARRNGIAANIHFVFLNTFIKELDPQTHILDHETMRGLVLDELLNPQHPIPEVQNYLQLAATPADYDRRTFQLADRLARNFSEYELSRPTMVDAWPRNTVLTEDPWLTTEQWQRQLWLRIFGPDGRITLLEKQGTKTRRLGQFLQEITHTPPRTHTLHFFGLSYLALQYYAVLEGLAQTNPVHIYAINPCMEFWEDLPTQWQIKQRKRFQKRHTPHASLDLRNDADTRLEDENDPVPLRLWGELGRDHVRHLNQLTNADFDPVFQDPLDDGDSLLHRIQHDIYARTPVTEITPGPVDDSLIILECPTIQREVEIIASEIWRLLKKSHEDNAPLDFNDFAVIVNPEERNSYQAHIRAVFRDTWDIPHNIIDITAADNRRFMEATQLLLNLPFGTLTREQLLKLLTHPNVIGPLEYIQPDLWKSWVHELNILYGADQNDLAETYIEKELFHWDQGLRRMALGVFIDQPAEDPLIFQNQWLPLSTPASQTRSVATLIRLTRRLLHQARTWRHQKHTLKTWFEHIADWIKTILSPLDDDDEIDAARILKTLDDARQNDLSTAEVSFQIALDSIQTLLQNLEITRGQYLAEGVVVSSFIPMRPLPFKVVFITGLGERLFPRNDSRSPLDLRWATSRRFDNFSSRRNDEYMFLETFISTRKHLYLSYVARNSHTGDELMPSSVVRELDFMIQRYYLLPEDAPKIHRKHPLRRFDPAYFNDDPNLINVHPQALLEARCLALHNQPITPEIKALLGIIDPPRTTQSPENLTLSIRQIRRFLENPLQGSAEFFLGIDAWDEIDIFSIDTEPFETPGPLRSTLQNIFLATWQKHQANLNLTHLEEACAHLFHIEELKGNLPTGIFLEAAQNRHIHQLRAWLHTLHTLNFDLAQPPAVHNFGQARELHLDTRHLDPLTLDIQTPQGPRHVTLTGKTTPILPNTCFMTLGTTHKLDTWQHEYLFLTAFLDAVILAATGHLQTSFQILVNANNPPTPEHNLRTFRPIDPHEATHWLSQLIQSLIQGVHNYQFPADAALEYALRNRQKATPKPFDRITPWSKLKWGPIPNPTDEMTWKIPESPFLDQLIQDRFGLYLAHKSE